MTTFKASKFKNRANLERQLSKDIGIDIQKNREEQHVLQGSRDELKRLNLNERSHVYGVRCEIVKSTSSKKTRSQKFIRTKQGKNG